jgi:hypothetical protein
LFLLQQNFLFVNDSTHIHKSGFSELIQLTDLLPCFFEACGTQVLKLFEVIVCVDQPFERFLERLQFFFHLIPLYLEPDLVFPHSIKNMLVTFRTEHGIEFFGLDVLKNLIQLVYLLLKSAPFSLYVLDLLRNEHSRVSEVRLLQLSVLDFGLDSAAGGLQMQKVLRQLRVLVVLHEIDL